MPGFRHFGFNNPDDIPDEDELHGYERWVTIPDNWNVQTPFIKKTFGGGLYAAYMSPNVLFDEWIWLHDWVANSEEYDFRWGTIGDNHCGWLEEYLNAPALNLIISEENNRCLQLDLLIPIEEK